MFTINHRVLWRYIAQSSLVHLCFLEICHFKSYPSETYKTNYNSTNTCGKCFILYIDVCMFTHTETCKKPHLYTENIFTICHDTYKISSSIMHISHSFSFNEIKSTHCPINIYKAKIVTWYLILLGNCLQNYKLIWTKMSTEIWCNW